MLRTAAMMLAGLLAAKASAAAPWDPRQQRVLAGPPTEILVLGSPHLSQLPSAFKAESLAPVLDRLAAWKPAIIAIENVSGEGCDALRRFAPEHEDAAATYCWDPAPAERATGLTVPAATTEARRLLAAWPAAPTAAQRRHLAAVFMATGDRYSALVQWLRLPAAERRAGDGLDAALVAELVKLSGRANESSQIASVLAARLGLERVHLVDDHSADGPPSGDDKARDAAMQQAWTAAAPRLAAMKAMEAKLGTPAATLDMYRFHNAPANAQVVFDSDFGAMLKEPSAGRWGRRYATWWEVRNLRMVANIAATFMDRPGARVLAIVGSSHKGYYEAYLDMLHDVKLADAMAVLK